MAWCKYDWQAVREYRAAGHTIRECCERFGFSEDAWYKAVARGVVSAPTLKQNRGGHTRYDWAAVQQYYDDGHTYQECKERFQFGEWAWQNAARKGRITGRGHRWPLKRLQREGRSPASLKQRLIEMGALSEICSECGLSEWRGKRIVIQLDHINGINTDNRVENLRMLCPNCHSQTETFGARNQRQVRARRPNSAGANSDGSPSGI